MTYQLSRIEELDTANYDTVGLADLLGSSEWQTVYMFNYMFDLPWLVQHFNRQSLVDLHIIYGYKSVEDEEGAELGAAAAIAREIAPNITIKLHGVRLLDRYGTHHSKIVILQGNSSLQIAILTANMVKMDWTHMCQGMWLSPVLKLTSEEPKPMSRFRADFCRYLRAYKLETIDILADNLHGYNFGPIVDVLVASVPGSHPKSYWGIRRLKKELAELPVDESVVQVSSIATLPENFLSVLAEALNCPRKGLRIVFPTMNNVEQMLDGWLSGQALHLKRQFYRQKQQCKMLRPYLRQWKAADSSRDQATPHIKTYTGITDNQVQYFLLTSANLSPQAWGVEKAGVLQIKSWECGVLRKNGDVQVPIKLPLTPYDSNDMPWSIDTFIERQAS